MILGGGVWEASNGLSIVNTNENPPQNMFLPDWKGGLGGLKRGNVPYFCRGGLSILQVNEGMALGWPQTEVGVVLGVV